MLLLTKQTEADILNLVKFYVIEMEDFPPFCLIGESQPHKTSEFIYYSQFSLFLPSLSFTAVSEWETPATSYIPNLNYLLSVNKALSACHVCPRLTRLFPVGHFVTSSTLCINQSIASCFMVAHMYIAVDLLFTSFTSRRNGVLLNYLGFLSTITEN
jgi:hypothetical protein